MAPNKFFRSPVAITLALIVALFATSLSQAYVGTNAANYDPGSTVTIQGDNRDGAGYSAGESVHVDVSGPNAYSAACEGVAVEGGAWSCQITLPDTAAPGNYAYSTTGLTSGAHESGAFAVGSTPVSSPSLAENTPAPVSSPEPTSTPVPPVSTTTIIVRMAAGLTPDQQAQVIARDGGVESSAIAVLRMHFVDVPTDKLADVLAKYRADAQVLSAETDKERQAEGTPSDPLYPDQWALPKIGWDTVYGSVTPAGTSVLAVLDTGIDASHPDLSGLVLPGYSVMGGDAWTDPNGHGTAMAGIAAATTGNGVGTAGVAYAGVKLLPVQVLGADGTGLDSDIITGIVWAVDNGANVILMAFSNPGYSPALQAALDYAWDSGAVLVAAAGNDGTNTLAYPAGDRGVMGVSATTADDTLAASSNYGQDVFLAAPGEGIATAGLNSGETTVSGTSASSAMVAGAAALMRAVDPSLSNGVVVGRLARSADAAGTVDQTGNGRLNLARALADGGTDVVKPAGAAPLGSGGPIVGPYVVAALGVTATYNADTVAISAIGSGQSGNKRWQYAYTSPGGAVTYHRCVPLASAGTDSLILPQNFDTGKWVVTLYEYNNNNQCKDDGTGVANKSASATNDVTVSKGNTSLTVSSANGTYGDTVSLSATLKLVGGATISGKTISFTLNGTSVGTATTDTSGVATLSNVSLGSIAVGTYSTGIVGNFAGDTSYNGSNVPASLKVDKTSLTITADNNSRSYGDTNPTFTASYSGFKNGESLATSGVTGAPSLTTTASATSPVTGSPYTITASLGTLAANNYSFTFVNGQLTINKAVLTVTADNKSRTYGTANPSFTASYSGFKNGETLATSGVTGSPSLGTTATTSSPVGGYTITAALGTLAAGNYSFSMVDGTLTVNPRALVVTATGVNKTYDGTTGATVTLSDNRIIGDVFTPSYTSASFADKNVGTGKPVSVSGISISGPAAGNYSANTTATTTADITPLLVTVTADAKTKTYGDADPALTYQVTSGSLVDGETFSGALSRAVGESIGAYTIEQGSLALSTNYALTYVGAKLSISPRPVTITADAQSKVYGDADPALTYQITMGSLAFSDAFSGALTRDAGENVGAYAIKQGTLALNANYTLSYKGADLGISARPITITADAQSKTYGDADPLTFTYKITDGSLVSGDAFTGALVRANGENIGTYAITQGGLALTTNYALTYIGAYLTINQRPVTVTADAITKIYGQGDPALTYNITSGSLAFSDIFIGGLSRAAGESVGSYAIGKGTLALSGNYNLSYVGADLTITPAILTVTADAQSKVYGDADPVLTYKASGFQFNDTEATVLTGSLTRAAGETVAASPYAIGIGSLTSNTNYTIAFTGNTLSITPAPLTITANPATKVYGQDNPTFSVSYSGFVNNEDPNVLGGTLSFATTANVSSAVGSYTVTPLGLTSTNYAITYQAGALVITPAPLTVTPGDANRLYGADNPIFTGSIVGIQNSDNITATYSTIATATSPVGTYDITATFNDPDSKLGNYIVTSNKGTLTVKPAPLTITANDQTKTYGDTVTFAGTEFTTSGLVNNDTVTNMTLASNGAVASAIVSGSPYAIVPSSAVGSGLGNYSISYSNGSLTVNKKAASVTPAANGKIYGDGEPTLGGVLYGFLPADGVTATYSRSSGEMVGIYTITASLAPTSVLGNYDIISNTAIFTIDKRPITVTTDAGQTKVYGEPDPALYTYKITKGNLVGSDVFTGALTRDPGEDVGTYTITQGTLALSGNYDLTYVGNMLSITQATLTTTADAQTITYGEVDPAFTFQYSGFKFTDNASVIDTVPTCGVSGLHVNAGSYDIVCSGGVDNNYTFTYNSAKLTVNPKPIQVTADAQSKTYGDADPALTYTYTPALVTGDSFSGALARVAGESVGSYAIGQGTVALSSNYDLTYVGATLTIEKASLTVTADNKSKVYGSDNPAFTASYTGFKRGETLVTSGVTGEPDLTTTATAASPVYDSPYLITAGKGTLAAGNYDFVFANGNLTITPAALTITTKAATKVYGDPNPGFAVDYNGFVLNENESVLSGTLAFTTSADKKSPVGSYLVTPSGLTSTNYDITFVEGILVVSKAPLTVTATDLTKVYGQANPTLDGVIIGIKNGDAITASYTTQATDSSDVGGYAIIPAAVDSAPSTLDNYDVKLINGTLTVTKAALTIAAEDVSKIYGDPNPALKVRYDGFVLEQDKNVLDGALAFDTSADASSPVGDYDVIPKGLTSGNYEITYVKGTLTVSKAPLTITADNQTKVYGEANPKLTGKIEGLKNGDAITASYSTAADATSGVGNYPIIPMAVDSDPTKLSNYEVTLVDGSLIVTKATLTVKPDNKSKEYGEPFTAFSGMIDGIQNGDAITASYDSVGAVAKAVVGSYDIKASLIDPDGKLVNYMVTLYTGKLTVTQAPLIIKADNKSKVYGEANPPLTGVITGIKNGDAITATYSTSAVINSPVGTYAIVPKEVDSNPSTLANYSVTLTNGTLSILYANGGLCLGSTGHSILQPINTDNTSVFKQGSTVPAKFRVCDANGISIGTPGVVTSFKLVKTGSGTVVSYVDEAVLSTTPDTAFRWSSSDQQWIFNINTKTLKANYTYFYKITLNDGTEINFQFGLK